MKRFLVFLFSSFLLHGCGPKVRTSLVTGPYTTLNYNDEVEVVRSGTPIPANAVHIADLRIGDSGFSTRCKYEVVIAAAKLEARKAGGNLIEIIEEKRPDFLSTCHRLRARILKVDLDAMHQAIAESEAEFIDTTLDYALVHFYRPSAMGFLVGYNLHLKDSVLCRVSSGTKSVVKVEEEGLLTFWARTEAMEELPVKIEHGRQYFIRCGLSTGVMVGRPVLELVPPRFGKEEFDKLKSEN